jgi:hypothetical protein
VSTDVYAGQLCATHVNEWVMHPRLDPALSWWIAVVSHTQTRPTVRVIALGINYSDMGENHRNSLPKKSVCLDLEPDDIITFAVR